VRERRRQVGVLRSLGLLSGPIGWSFIVEAALVAIEGTAIGVALGILTAYNIITATTLVGLDVAFVVPAGDIAVLVAFVIVTSLLMTVVPARRASRIRPAVALRIAD
ncbi:MAG: FtsX-like permease family protein, partial [Ilumatobacteraceae bacterium]|nr:FtsX-like permease family protein [Ilumatobacteraceae bacterium]